MTHLGDGVSGLRLVERGACCVLLGAHLLGCSGQAAYTGGLTNAAGASNGVPSMSNGVSGASNGVSGAGGFAGTGGGGVPAPTQCPSYGTAETLEMRASNAPPYEGPAIIERSTLDELVVYFTAPPRSGPSGVPSEPMHVTLNGLTAMPIFPVGAKVWLSEEYQGPNYYFDHTFKFALHDRENGTLLLSAGLSSAGQLEPVPVDNVQVLCEAKTWNNGCASPSTVTYDSVDVQADTKVTFRNGEMKSVTIGGIAYDAAVSAATSYQACVNDAVPMGGVLLRLMAQDLETRIAQLEVGEPPACGEGNARSQKLYVYNDSALPYAGPVVVTVLPEDRRPHFIFPGATVSDRTPGFGWFGEDAQFPTLTPGDTVWATLTANTQEGSLRRTQNAPFLVASTVDHAVADVVAGATWSEPIFDGVSITAEPRCTYTNSGPDGAPHTLFDVTFGTVPPVRIKSGEAGTVTLGGTRYSAWVEGMGSISVTLHPE